MLAFPIAMDVSSALWRGAINARTGAKAIAWDDFLRLLRSAFSF